MIFEQKFFSNSLIEWGTAIILAIFIMIALKIILKIATRKITRFSLKTKTKIDDLLAEVLKNTKFFFIFFLAVYLGKLTLVLPIKISTMINHLVFIALLIQCAIWGNSVILFIFQKYKEKKLQEDATTVTTFSMLAFISRIILWSLIILLALDNFGIDITALVAGMGIAGIAIALAVQNVLGDLLASLSIVLDKPFVLGDFIIVDTHRGTVEHIGLKTTRIRSLSGEQLIFSNNDLLQSRIQNFKRMKERRIVFSVGVVYQTSGELLAAIPDMIREIIESLPLTRFERAHFKEFGNFSLNFEVVYWISSPDYTDYMNTQQDINLKIFKRFQEQNIEFAYPSQTIFIEKSDPVASNSN